MSGGFDKSSLFYKIRLGFSSHVLVASVNGDGIIDNN
jgi:hypothetical protein